MFPSTRFIKTCSLSLILWAAIFLDREGFGQSFDTKVRGSLIVGMDTLKIDDAKWTNHIGVNIFDLKVYAYGESTRVKFKLDLDTQSPDIPYKLVEEAIITQRLSPVVSVTMGKGVVPFIRKQVAINLRSYFDYGSILDNFYWTYKDVDRNLLTTLTLGNWSVGMKHSLTIFGEDNREYKRNQYTQEIEQQGQRKQFESSTLTYNPGDQRGYSYRLDYYYGRDWEFSFAALQYLQNDDPHKSYAFDFGGRYQAGDLSRFYFEILAGRSAKKYSFEDKNELVGQIGGGYPLTEKLVLGIDWEYARYNFMNTFQDANKTIDGWNYMVIFGPEYHISRRVTFANTLMMERLRVKGDTRIAPNKDPDVWVEKKALGFVSTLGTFF